MTDAFPPTSAAEVLALCDGAWMSLRSQLQPADTDEGWHTSEKGELKLSWTASENTDELGRMEATPPSGQSTVLTFLADGRLEGSSGQQGAQLGGDALGADHDASASGQHFAIGSRISRHAGAAAGHGFQQGQ